MFTDKEKKIFELYTECHFKPYFIRFIEYKRSKGYVYGLTALHIYKRINNVMAEYGGNIITRDMVDFVIARMADDDGRILTRYLSAFRKFTEYMAMYEPLTFVIPQRYWALKGEKMRTFVFTEEELNAITEAVDAKCQSVPRLVNYGTPPHPFIMRILIGTGMRIGEVLSLRRCDLDFSNNVISVIDGKGGVSRLVPMSSSLADALSYYVSATRRDDGSLLFISRCTGGPMNSDNITHFVRGILNSLGITERGGDKPTLHSFRHTFCTHSMEKLLADGIDFYTALPILGAYVGHTNIRSLEKYVHFNGITVQEFNKRQASLESLIPEVYDEDI